VTSPDHSADAVGSGAKDATAAGRARYSLLDLLGRRRRCCLSLLESAVHRAGLDPGLLESDDLLAEAREDILDPFRPIERLAIAAEIVGRTLDGVDLALGQIPGGLTNVRGRFLDRLDVGLDIIDSRLCIQLLQGGVGSASLQAASRPASRPPSSASAQPSTGRCSRIQIPRSAGPPITREPSPRRNEMKPPWAGHHPDGATGDAAGGRASDKGSKSRRSRSMSGC
jgi:hypothetical protein